MSIIKRQYQHGFTMIEVLIAAVVLGVGLLGLAALQAQSLQFNYSAYQRSQANLLAYDIIDRMRANGPEVLIGSYNQAFGNGPTSNTDCQVVGANCSAADMAAFDITEWECSLGRWNDVAPCAGRGIVGPLAEGDGEVVIGAPVAGHVPVTVTITWVDNRTLDEGDANRTESFSVSTVL